MCRYQRTHDAEQPPPETRNATRSTPDRRRESLRRPTIEHGVEHRLEEIFHDIEADVGSLGVDGCEEEEGEAHECGRAYHSPLAPDAGDRVHECAEEDAEDAGEVDEDEVAVGFFG